MSHSNCSNECRQCNPFGAPSNAVPTCLSIDCPERTGGKCNAFERIFNISKAPHYDEIKPWIEKRLVNEQVHPEDPNVRIFNYTQECQFSGEWNDITRQCRGLIINIATGEVLARPFPKFFNYGEHLAKGWPIPHETPIITDKYDGSLGILYQLNGKPWIATRGSFASDQALWATDYYRKNIGHDAPKGETFLFEIIYPENRIVVNYDFSGLVFLGSLEIKSGQAVPRENMFARQAASIFPGSAPDDVLQRLSEMDQPNSEGFVLFFPVANVRMKIKFPEYVRLHKLITGVSEIAIWEHLRDGNGVNDLLEKVPDEFFRWVNDVQNTLLSEYERIEYFAETSYRAAKWLTTRKEQAALITTKPYPGIAFAMLDGKDYKPMIWRLVRPHGQRQFKIDIDL